MNPEEKFDVGIENGAVCWLFESISRSLDGLLPPLVLLFPVLKGWAAAATGGGLVLNGDVVAGLCCLPAGGLSGLGTKLVCVFDEGGLVTCFFFSNASNNFFCSAR